MAKSVMNRWLFIGMFLRKPSAFWNRRKIKTIPTAIERFRLWHLWSRASLPRPSITHVRSAAKSGNAIVTFFEPGCIGFAHAFHSRLMAGPDPAGFGGTTAQRLARTELRFDVHRLGRLNSPGAINRLDNGML